MEANQSLPGVYCDVVNCAYHGIDHMCHADEIHVENQEGVSEAETDTFCGTFISK